MNSIAQDKIDKIKAVVLDIDGVLTDGKLGYSAADEIKFFNVLDGHGIKMAQRAGLLVGVLSGRKCVANRKRAEELGLSFFYEGSKDKKATFSQLLQEHNLTGEECLCIGDDIVDIPMLLSAGIGVTVADALEYMSLYCDFRTVRGGGCGAVREVLDWLLQRQGKWEKLMERYVR